MIWAATWENRIFAYAKTKTQISCAVTAQLISVFVFATRIVQSLYFLNPKLWASSHLQYCPARFVSDLVGNPKDRSSDVAAHLIPIQVSCSHIILDVYDLSILQEWFITQTCPCNILQYFMAVKMAIFIWKKMWQFSYLCSKHRSWVHVGTASLRQF